MCSRATINRSFGAENIQQAIRGKITEPTRSPAGVTAVMLVLSRVEEVHGFREYVTLGGARRVTPLDALVAHFQSVFHFASRGIKAVPGLSVRITLLEVSHLNPDQVGNTEHVRPAIVPGKRILVLPKESAILAREGLVDPDPFLFTLASDHERGAAFRVRGKQSPLAKTQ